MPFLSDARKSAANAKIAAHEKQANAMTLQDTINDVLQHHREPRREEGFRRTGRHDNHGGHHAQERTVLDYLLKPIPKAENETMRESGRNENYFI